MTDAGGTTYDVSLSAADRSLGHARRFVGHPSYGYMTGFPSVDVRSIGAGGGTIAWVDEGGLLHVGPAERRRGPGPGVLRPRRQRARPSPTPASCSGTSTRTTSSAARCRSTSASPQRRSSATSRSRSSLDRPRQRPSAVLDLAIERMVHRDRGDHTHAGHRPARRGHDRRRWRRGALRVGIARRLGSPQVVIPDVSRPRSRATGALLSDLQTDFAAHGGDVDRRLRSRPRPTRSSQRLERRWSRVPRGDRVPTRYVERGAVCGRGSIPASGLGDRGPAPSRTPRRTRRTDVDLLRGLPPGTRRALRRPRHGLPGRARHLAGCTSAAAFARHADSGSASQSLPPATSTTADAPTSPRSDSSRSVSERSTTLDVGGRVRGPADRRVTSHHRRARP